MKSKRIHKKRIPPKTPTPKSFINVSGDVPPSVVEIVFAFAVLAAVFIFVCFILLKQ